MTQQDKTSVTSQAKRFIWVLLFVAAVFPMAVMGAQPEIKTSLPSLESPAIGESEHQIRGQLSPLHHTVVSSEVSALITTLKHREGENFKAGNTLAVFDCSIYQAQLQKAKAGAEAANRKLKVSERLDKLNAISTLELEQAASHSIEAGAQVRVMEVTVRKCRIRAPFSGRVVKRFAEPFQYVQPGTPLLEILDPINLEIQLVVPSHWLTWLNQGAQFYFHVEENKHSYPARIVRVGTMIDPISQSIPVAGKITGKHPELLPGMSGWAKFSLPEKAGRNE